MKQKRAVDRIDQSSISVSIRAYSDEKHLFESVRSPLYIGTYVLQISSIDSDIAKMRNTLFSEASILSCLFLHLNLKWHNKLLQVNLITDAGAKTAIKCKNIFVLPHQQKIYCGKC